ncbi:MAG: metal-sulfur cluster assembly factor [Candidatus Roizmanbacteria bacterium]
MLKDKVMKKLDEVIDPEMHISIVELGLVYDVKIKNSTAFIKMTLTSLGCPLFPVIEKSIIYKTKEVPTIENVDIELTFDPPWTMDMMSKKARLTLGV